MRGPSTCDVTETFLSGLRISRADIFDHILPSTRSDPSKPAVLFRLPLTCLGVPIQGKAAKAKAEIEFLLTFRYL